MSKKIIALIVIGVLLAFSITFVVVNFDNLFTNNLPPQQEQEMPGDADKNKIVIDYEYIYF